MGEIMLSKYFVMFRVEHDYQYIGPGLIKQFDEYLELEDIPLDEAYYHITPFCDTLNVRSKTKMNYRTRLRRYVEFVYDLEDIKIVDEGELIW